MDRKDREAALAKSKIWNNIIKLRKTLEKENEENEKLVRYIKNEWIPVRQKTLDSLRRKRNISNNRKDKVNTIQIPLKSVSAAAKLTTMASIACPPLFIGALATSAVMDGLCCVASSADASATDDDLKDVSEVLKRDDDATKELKKRLNNYKLVTMELEENVKDFHRATISGMFDRDGHNFSEIKGFIKEVKMIDVLDLNGISAFLNACEKFFSGIISVSSLARDVWLAICHVFTNNPAIGDSIAYGVEAGLAIGGGAAAISSLRAAGAIGTGVGRCVAGLNLALAAKDVADITVMGCELSDSSNNRDTTALAKKLRVIQNKLENEEKQIMEALRKARR